MSSQTNYKSGGISFLGALTLLFVTLKLTGVLDWSWFWVISPMLVPVAFVLGILLLSAVIVGVCHAVASWTSYNIRRSRKPR